MVPCEGWRHLQVPEEQLRSRPACLPVPVLPGRAGSYLCTGSRRTSLRSRSHRRISTRWGCSVRSDTRTGSSGSSRERRWGRLQQMGQHHNAAALEGRWGGGRGLRTTIGLVGVVPAVVHAVALPLQAHTHAVSTLEGVGVAHLPELRRNGCAATHEDISVRKPRERSRTGHVAHRSRRTRRPRLIRPRSAWCRRRPGTGTGTGRGSCTRTPCSACTAALQAISSQSRFS